MVFLIAALLGEPNMKILIDTHPIGSNCPWPEVILAALKEADGDPGVAGQMLREKINTATDTKRKTTPKTTSGRAKKGRTSKGRDASSARRRR